MKCIFCSSTTHSYRSCPLSYGISRPAFKQDFFGQAPNVFIGRYGYPNVRIGVLGTEQYKMHDDPLLWTAKRTPIQNIVGLRGQLVNSYFAGNVKTGGKFLDLTREVSLAKKPVDVEINLQKKPGFRLSFSDHAAPHGPTVKIDRARITQNVKIHNAVEKATSATDLRAADAVSDLSRKGIDGYALQKAFSMGNFGLPTERKLVPTKWSITAVDDIKGKDRIEEVKKHRESDCLAYLGGHYGNYYLIMFFDTVWEYELFEQHLSSSQVWTDYEPYTGRTSYAVDTAGGYYAARIGILDHLAKSKRQSGVLAIRVITDEYTVPLGVWVVREAVRQALQTEPIRFADRTLLLDYAKHVMKRKYSLDIEPLLGRSRLMKNIFGQQRLTQF